MSSLLFELDDALQRLKNLESENARLRGALEKIAYAQGDGHPLILMKVARQALEKSALEGEK